MLSFGPRLLAGLTTTSGRNGLVSVWVADRYLAAHSGIRKDSVRLREFPREFVPPGALSADVRLEDERLLPLFTSAIAIPEGQPLTRALVVDSSQSDSLSNLLRPGKVAVSFEVDRAHGVGGWVRPGDSLALFVSSSERTRLLFSNVQVLAVDDQRLEPLEPRADANEEQIIPEYASLSSARVVTVLLNPIDASTLIEARERGPIQTVLRSKGDDLPWPTAK